MATYKAEQANTLKAPPGARVPLSQVLLLDLPTELLCRVLHAASTVPLPLRQTCHAFRDTLDAGRHALRLQLRRWQIPSSRPRHLISLLQRLPQLRSLDCSTFPTPTFHFLPDCPLLTHLSLRNSSITPVQLRELAACPRLTTLDLSCCNGLWHLDHLPLLPLLHSLDLSHNSAIQDISPLTRCQQLAALNFTWAASWLTDLRPLTRLSALSTMTASDKWGAGVLAPISSCTCLTLLDLNGSRAAALPTLAGLTRLTHLSLCHFGGLQLTHNINVVASVSSLTYLDLSGTSAGDLGSLAACTRLRTLRVGTHSLMSPQQLSTLQEGCGLQLAIQHT